MTLNKVKEEGVKKITKEFIKYGSGEKHQDIVNTLIKEIFYDTGNAKEFHKAGASDEVNVFGIEKVLLSGQNMYVNDINKLTYKII